MYTEIISTDRLENLVLGALNQLSRSTIGDASGEASPAAQALNVKLKDEFVTLHQVVNPAERHENSTEIEILASSGKQHFAAMIVFVVARVQELSSDDVLGLLQDQELAIKTSGSESQANASRDFNIPQVHFNTSGWDGRSWHIVAKNSYVSSRHSYHEFVGNAKDVLLEFLEDGIKEGLTKGVTDAALDGVRTVLSLAFGQGVVLMLAQTPLLLFILGTVLLFMLRYAQTDAISVPADCACVWNRIRRIYATKGVVNPEDVNRIFRKQGQLYPRPYNLAPCDIVSMQQVVLCPFRYQSQQGNFCCKLAYDDDESFGMEGRDDKVARTFQKLEMLGLLETRIDSGPTDYFLK